MLLPSNAFYLLQILDSVSNFNLMARPEVKSILEESLQSEFVDTMRNLGDEVILVVFCGIILIAAVIVRVVFVKF